MSTRLISPRDYSRCVQRLRNFFLQRNFIEVHTQSALSILAACEDPSTISIFEYENRIWPLPQTGQMWLEHVLLSNPSLRGCFCVSTSFRNEPSPVPGRHERIFPMFEFEMPGDMNDLLLLEKDLLRYIGFPKKAHGYPEDDYDNVANEYNVDILEHEHEDKLYKDYGEVFFLKNFPFRTSPFWNMKADFHKKTSNKVDVILHGMETIGAAERSCDKDEMRYMFNTISGGQYASLLWKTFSKKRIDNELDEFLSHRFFPRVGGGIGITRMMRAMKMSNLYK